MFDTMHYSDMEDNTASRDPCAPPLTLPDAEGIVYASGPITGLTYEESRYGWRKEVADKLLPGIRLLSPMRHEGHLAEIQGKLTEVNFPEHFFSGAKIIVQKDLLDIKRCDIMLVNFLHSHVISKGTLVEMGMAYALGKTIVTCIRPNEPGRLNACHMHPFVTETSSLVLDNLDDAIEAVNSLLSIGV